MTASRMTLVFRFIVHAVLFLNFFASAILVARVMLASDHSNLATFLVPMLVPGTIYAAAYIYVERRLPAIEAWREERATL